MAAVTRNGRADRCHNRHTFGVRLCKLHLGRARVKLGDSWDAKQRGAFVELYRAVGAEEAWL